MAILLIISEIFTRIEVENRHFANCILTDRRTGE